MDTSAVTSTERELVSYKMPHSSEVRQPTHPTRWRSLRAAFLVLLQPAGTAIGAMLALVTLLVATNKGQFTSIASYGAGVAIAAIVAAVVGGGTTLAFTTGNEERQRAVRNVRKSVVVPSIVLSTGGAVVVYSVINDLQPLAVVAGGIATASTVSAELDASYLRRKLRTVGLFSGDLASRATALLLIVIGVEFAYVMLAGSLIRSSMLSVFARRDPTRKFKFRLSKSDMAQAYEVKLTSLSIAYVLADRIGALVVPFTSSPVVAGGYNAVIGIQQNISGVIMSGVQTVLAIRTERGSELRWTLRLEFLFVLLAGTACAVMLMFSDQLMRLLGLSSLNEPHSYWTAIAALIPLALLSRVLDFQFIAKGKAHVAALSRITATAVILLGALIGVLNTDIEIVVWALVIGELASVLTSVTASFVRRKRKAS